MYWYMYFCAFVCPLCFNSFHVLYLLLLSPAACAALAEAEALRREVESLKLLARDALTANDRLTAEAERSRAAAEAASTDAVVSRRHAVEARGVVGGLEAARAEAAAAAASAAEGAFGREFEFGEGCLRILHPAPLLFWCFESEFFPTAVHALRLY